MLLFTDGLWVETPPLSKRGWGGLGGGWLQPTVPARLFSPVSYFPREGFFDHPPPLFHSIHVPLCFLYVLTTTLLVTGATALCNTCLFNTSLPDSGMACEHADHVCLSCCPIPGALHTSWQMAQGQYYLMDGWMNGWMNEGMKLWMSWLPSQMFRVLALNFCFTMIIWFWRYVSK